MTKQQLSLIRQASIDHADDGTAWRKRMERWMEIVDPKIPRCFMRLLHDPDYNYWIPDPSLKKMYKYMSDMMDNELRAAVLKK